MNPSEASIQAKVANAISAFGSTIGVRKYSSGPSDLYKHGQPTYAASVNCTGRAIYKPTPEQVSAIGSTEQFDLAVLFSRTELVAKFPLAAERAWIDERDRIVAQGVLYEVTRVHPSGRIKDYEHLVILLCNTIEGRRTETP